MSQPSVLNPEGRPPAPAHVKSSGKKRRLVKWTSAMGQVIEYYDFTIYGLAAALVFPHVFFPGLGDSAALVASFATFGVAFVARPAGGLLFGHFGDKFGRKTTLIVTLVVMGIATTAIGFLPTASTIGVGAPIILVVLRFVQGLTAGGEWAGANLFAGEHAPPKQRGRWAMWPQLGSAGAFVLGNGTFFLTGLSMSDEVFLSWGWRVPFLASSVLLIIGLYVRLQTDETPVFKKALEDDGVRRMPVVAAIKDQPREIFLGCGVGIAMGAFFYLSSTYLAAFASNDLGLSRNAIFFALTIGGVFVLLGSLTSGLLSDRFRRRKLLVQANFAALVWSLVLFPILSIGNLAAFATCLSVTLFISGFLASPLGAFLPEQFQTSHRYTASAITYSVGAMLGGSIPPLIAPKLVGEFGPFALGGFLAFYSLIALLCVRALRDVSTASLTEV
ncbi:MAG: MFS transporter [Rhodococcus sp. (in: high G+C Gram-positive bacteria)]|nr:MAG: MFS transporter [Rhodococcus sp. (in: high G+C Gram-positive bacteria)]